MKEKIKSAIHGFNKLKHSKSEQNGHPPLQDSIQKSTSDLLES